MSQLQKQLHNIHRKKPALESLFNRVAGAGLKTYNCIKRDKVFSVNIAKILRASISKKICKKLLLQFLLLIVKIFFYGFLSALNSISLFSSWSSSKFKEFSLGCSVLDSSHIQKKKNQPKWPLAVPRCHSLSLVVPLIVICFHSLSFVVTRCTTFCHSLSFVVTRCTTRCHLLSFVVTRCTTCCHSLSFVVTRCTTRCHWLSFVLTRCTTCCHSLSVVVTRCTTRLSFYKCWHEMG